MKRSAVEVGTEIQPLKKGKRVSTVVGKAIAYNHFLVFWDCCIKLEKTQENLCQIEIFEKYGTYLKTIKTLSKNDFFSKDSAVQYLSGAKNTIRSMYPLNPIWNGHDSDLKGQGINPWYTELREALKGDISYGIHMIYNITNFIRYQFNEYTY